MDDILAQLSVPFPPSAIEWKPGSITKDATKCMALAYADFRAYMERLDEVCGMNWSITYSFWGDRRICAHLTINGVTRSSIGEMEDQDIKNQLGGTVAEAMAAKRAATQFGLGRDLYSLPSVWVPFDAQSKKISAEGLTQLNSRYAAWYAKKIASLPKQEPKREPVVDADFYEQAPTPQQAQEQAEAAEVSEDTLDYSALAYGLQGDNAKFVELVRQAHADSDGPPDEIDYKLLAGELDKLTEGNHRILLGVLVGRPVNKHNPPGKKAVVNLRERISKQIAKKVNPKYKETTVDAVKELWAAIKPQLAPTLIAE